VQVSPYAGHSEQSEVQLHEGDRRGEQAWSVKRKPMGKNRLQGVAEQGERAGNREALVTEVKRRRRGSCAMKECGCYLGSRVMPDRETWRRLQFRSQQPADECPECAGARAERTLFAPDHI
jgi:hypothetical protein